MDFNPPLLWIHLNVDYPFNLKGILYFPQQSNKLQVMPGEIKLYNNQVYIADNIKEVVPEYLMLLKGVIDCPDLPLNVSRSFLQNDGDVQKISRHITKKVSDKLHSVFEEDRASFEGYWEDIAPFIKFGCIKDEKFYDRVKDIVLFKTLNHDYRTLEEYRKENEGQIFYVTDENVQAQYIRLFQENGMNAVLLTHAIDSHFISFLAVSYTHLDVYKRQLLRHLLAHRHRRAHGREISAAVGAVEAVRHGNGGVFSHVLHKALRRHLFRHLLDLRRVVDAQNVQIRHAHADVA